MICGKSSLFMRPIVAILGKYYRIVTMLSQKRHETRKIGQNIVASLAKN